MGVTYSTTHLIVAVATVPDTKRPDMPWVCVIANPDTTITIGAFRTEVRAKMWGTNVARVLGAYGVVTDELLNEVVGIGFPDDFAIETKLH
jgi:hypothetical protein